MGIACSKTNYNLTKLICLIYKYIHLVVDCLIALPEQCEALVAAAEFPKGSVQAQASPVLASPAAVQCCAARVFYAGQGQ